MEISAEAVSENDIFRMLLAYVISVRYFRLDFSLLWCSNNSVNIHMHYRIIQFGKYIHIIKEILGSV